ncbi:hypothetical protein BST33_04755 [Mycolicibacter minnesotensis]|uniref:Uncharacterized protein n=1 Tax=Mycolicibacter minnesotensis TaxID=1118379 RepID=A0AA91M7I2_9MYCO|nr:hypothetical protein BST33_04755 [Mycolicibacter minnesotensis]
MAPEPDDDSTDVDAADDHTSDHAGPPAAAVDDADAADDVVDAEPDDAEGESDAAQDVEQRG